MLHEGWTMYWRLPLRLLCSWRFNSCPVLCKKIFFQEDVINLAGAWTPFIPRLWHFQHATIEKQVINRNYIQWDADNRRMRLQRERKTKEKNRIKLEKAQGTVEAICQWTKPSRYKVCIDLFSAFRKRSYDLPSLSKKTSACTIEGKGMIWFEYWKGSLFGFELKFVSSHSLSIGAWKCSLAPHTVLSFLFCFFFS